MRFLAILFGFASTVAGQSLATIGTPSLTPTEETKWKGPVLVIGCFLIVIGNVEIARQAPEVTAPRGHIDRLPQWMTSTLASTLSIVFATFASWMTIVLVKILINGDAPTADRYLSPLILVAIVVIISIVIFFLFKFSLPETNQEKSSLQEHASVPNLRTCSSGTKSPGGYIFSNVPHDESREVSENVRIFTPFTVSLFLGFLVGAILKLPIFLAHRNGKQGNNG